jgi:hypothetical protein
VAHSRQVLYFNTMLTRRIHSSATRSYNPYISNVKVLEQVSLVERRPAPIGSESED